MNTCHIEAKKTFRFLSLFLLLTFLSPIQAFSRAEKFPVGLLFSQQADKVNIYSSIRNWEAISLENRKMMYRGKLYYFACKYEWKDDSKDEFIIKGFQFNKSESRFESKIFSGSDGAEQGPSAQILVLGLNNPPEEFRFTLHDSVKANEKKYVPFKKEFFFIDGVTPIQMRMDEPLQSQSHKDEKIPQIILVVNPSDKREDTEGTGGHQAEDKPIDVSSGFSSVTVPDEISVFFKKDLNIAKSYEYTDRIAEKRFEIEKEEVNKLKGLYGIKATSTRKINEYRFEANLYMEKMHELNIAKTKRDHYKNTVSLLEKEKKQITEKIDLISSAKQNVFLPTLFLTIPARLSGGIDTKEPDQIRKLSLCTANAVKKIYLERLKEMAFKQLENGKDFNIETRKYCYNVAENLAERHQFNLLERTKTAITTCKTDPANQSKIQSDTIYYITDLYAVTSRMNKILPLTESALGSENIIEDKNELMNLPPEMEYCEEKDQAIQDAFYAEASAQEKRAGELNAQQKDAWESYWNHVSDIGMRLLHEQKRLEETDALLAKYRRLLESLATENPDKKGLDQSYILANETVSVIKSNAARFNISVVGEGVGKSPAEAYESMLEDGLQRMSKRYLSMLDRIFGEMVRKDSGTFQISENQVALENSVPVCWRKDGADFHTAGKIDYALALSEESLPLQDPLMGIRRLFVTSEKAPKGVVYTDHFSKKQWWHIGWGDYGFIYEDAAEFSEKEKGDWRLPSIDMLEKIKQKTGTSPSLLKDILPGRPYWTSDIHISSNPHVFCFGNESQCRDWAADTYYPKTDACAILLVRPIAD